MSHKHKHHEQHEQQRQNNTGGIIAIMLTIVVTGGLVYLGLSNKPASSASKATEDSSMEGHHSGASGPVTDINTLVGQPAPDFQLTDHSGKTYALSQLKGKKIVLFFNEGLMCYPACWNQIASLGADARFKGEDIVALSVVVDPTKDWNDAIEKMPELAVATVVHDTGGAVSSMYGMLKTASSMHYGQLPGHSYVVIDKEGIVRHVYDDPNMAIHNDALAAEVAKI